jgi:hypothetical protein
MANSKVTLTDFVVLKINFSRLAKIAYKMIKLRLAERLIMYERSFEKKI